MPLPVFIPLIPGLEPGLEVLFLVALLIVVARTVMVVFTHGDVSISGPGRIRKAAQVLLGRFAKARELLGAHIDYQSWDINKSWGTNITAVGAILGTVLGAKLSLKDPTKPPPAWWNEATPTFLLFGAVAIVGALVYTATRRPEQNADADATDVSYHGYIWAFLTASFLTVWSVLVELLVLSRLIAATDTPGWLVQLFCVTIGVAAFLVLVYAWETIGGTLRHTKDEDDKNRPTTALL